MRYRTSLLLSGALIALMFLFRFLVNTAAAKWINEGVLLSIFDRLLLGIAAFCGQFWPFMCCAIIIAVLGATSLINLVRRNASR